MQVFSVDFIGHYPVGTAAIVIAETAEDAFEMAKQMLIECGLWDENDFLNNKNSPRNFTIANLNDFDLTKTGTYMLLDGNY